MPFVILATLGSIGYKAWQNKGIPIDSVVDPSGIPSWAILDEIPDTENEIDKPWYGKFYQDDAILGILVLYVVLKTKPWK